jgi:hypothetical protein
MVRGKETRHLELVHLRHTTKRKDIWTGEQLPEPNRRNHQYLLAPAGNSYRDWVYCLVPVI